jgi:hypothetical protein
LAKHLTVRDHVLFQTIEEAELVPAIGAWGRLLTQPHIVELVQAFNNLSHFVTCTLVDAKTEQVRVKFVVYFVKLFRKLKKLRSFHSMMAVVSGFANASARWFLQTEFLTSGFSQEIHKFIGLLEPMEGWPTYSRWLQEAQRKKKFFVPFLPAHLASFAILHDAKKRSSDLGETEVRISSF